MPRLAAPFVGYFSPWSEPVQIDELDQVRQVNALVQAFQLGLELGVLEHLVLQVAAQFVEVEHPFVDDRLHGVGEKAAGEERLDQAVRHQRAQDALIERPPGDLIHALGSSAI